MHFFRLLFIGISSDSVCMLPLSPTSSIIIIAMMISLHSTFKIVGYSLCKRIYLYIYHMPFAQILKVTIRYVFLPTLCHFLLSVRVLLLFCFKTILYFYFSYASKVSFCAYTKRIFFPSEIVSTQ